MHHRLRLPFAQASLPEVHQDTGGRGHGTVGDWRVKADNHFANLSIRLPGNGRNAGSVSLRGGERSRACRESADKHRQNGALDSGEAVTHPTRARPLLQAAPPRGPRNTWPGSGGCAARSRPYHAPVGTESVKLGRGKEKRPGPQARTLGVRHRRQAVLPEHQSYLVGRDRTTHRRLTSFLFSPSSDGYTTVSVAWGLRECQ